VVVKEGTEGMRRIEVGIERVSLHQWRNIVRQK
jgi:hypothetical protein